FWIAAFGEQALYKDLHDKTNIEEAVNHDITVALLSVFNTLLMSFLKSVLSLLLIFIFLVTSADSATYILGSMTTGGSMNPPVFQKIVWGVLISAIAGVLLLAGGLNALQTASLVAALPFAVILLIMLAAIYRMLKKEPIPISKRDIRRYRRIEKASTKLAKKEK